jgi:hypothetical protein
MFHRSFPFLLCHSFFNLGHLLIHIEERENPTGRQ